MTIAPRTLTKAQYLQTKIGARDQNYAGYESFIARRRAPVRPQTGTPAGRPNPPAAALATAAGGLLVPDADPYTGIIAGLPQPLTQAQIMAQAKAQISPLIASVSGQIGKQTQAETNAIKGYTTDAASKLAAIDWGAPYQQGEQQQAGVDSALRQALAGGGQSDADALAKRLAVIDDPTVAAAAGQLSANGAANGNTQLAQGSAALGNLISDASSAQSYGQKQPGIQRLSGLQAIAQAGQAAQASIAQQSEALQAQLPSIIQNLQATSDARATALTGARENQVARQDAIASGSASASAKAAATTQTNQTRLTIAELNAQGKASAAQQTQARSDRSYRLSFANTFKFDPVSGKTLPGYTRNANGSVVKVSKAGTGPNGKPISLTTLTGLVDTWHKGTSQVPVKGSDGKQVLNADGTPKYQVSGQVTYQQAYALLRKRGVTDETARQVLDTQYRKGELGRGWLTNEQQQVLKSSGRYAPAKTIPLPDGTTGAYITLFQADALRRAGRLPAGERAPLADGTSVYFIHQG